MCGVPAALEKLKLLEKTPPLNSKTLLRLRGSTHNEYLVALTDGRAHHLGSQARKLIIGMLEVETRGRESVESGCSLVIPHGFCHESHVQLL